MVDREMLGGASTMQTQRGHMGAAPSTRWSQKQHHQRGDRNNGLKGEEAAGTESATNTSLRCTAQAGL